jgi:hypothetical protein
MGGEPLENVVQSTFNEGAREPARRGVRRVRPSHPRPSASYLLRHRVIDLCGVSAVLVKRGVRSRN